MRIAVGEFRNEEIIADQKGRNHRAIRNIERLKQESADHQCNDQGMEDHAYCFGKATLFPFGSGLHTHQPVISYENVRGGSCSLWGGDKQLRGIRSRAKTNRIYLAMPYRYGTFLLHITNFSLQRCARL